VSAPSRCHGQTSLLSLVLHQTPFARVFPQKKKPRQARPTGVDGGQIALAVGFGGGSWMSLRPGSKRLLPLGASVRLHRFADCMQVVMTRNRRLRSNPANIKHSPMSLHSVASRPTRMGLLPKSIRVDHRSAPDQRFHHPPPSQRPARLRPALEKSDHVPLQSTTYNYLLF